MTSSSFWREADVESAIIISHRHNHSSICSCFWRLYAQCIKDAGRGETMSVRCSLNLVFWKENLALMWCSLTNHYVIPILTTRWPNAGLILVHCLRRWSSINPALISSSNQHNVTHIIHHLWKKKIIFYTAGFDDDSFRETVLTICHKFINFFTYFKSSSSTASRESMPQFTALLVDEDSNVKFKHVRVFTRKPLCFPINRS